MIYQSYVDLTSPRVEAHTVPAMAASQWRKVYDFQWYIIFIYNVYPKLYEETVSYKINM